MLSKSRLELGSKEKVDRWDKASVKSAKVGEKRSKERKGGMKYRFKLIQ